MEKKSVRRFSALGLVLLGASALTAAIVPSKPAPEQANSLNNGTLRQFSGGDGAIANVFSCVTLIVAAHCHKTVTAANVTGTTGGAITTVAINGLGQQVTTRGNTSLSVTVGAVDTTSILVRI
ncbi:hypothetical protein HHL16_18975 [Pseudoflavitalea sp. G-6-1-2]|uniref:hypothetical protein n=1 Tax=Pseudoflavitalea sp. G-6-1-2 TaxID=2728841 RepID=UPI00146B67E5|nr:hypothetical protein [Pseudoflavitalea sp. G-6-1-2]NML22968.1 hypothetical protein [Pseudoflavitalea sp. G-6-1-2]